MNRILKYDSAGQYYRVGDASLAARVKVAQVVGELLQFVGAEGVVIPQQMVACGPGGSLEKQNNNSQQE